MILHEKTAFGPTKLMIHMGNAGIHSCERCETHEGKDVVTGRQMELQKILDPDSAWFGRWLCWICIGRVYPQFLFSPRTRRGARRAPAQAGGRIS